MVLGMRAVANAAAGGNTVILKTSEYAPKTHLAIGQLFLDAGFPPGVINVVHVATKDAPEVGIVVSLLQCRRSLSLRS
jgi:acyl-CoA reductase-like NAD-dependent aldehyde dehydrogenase